MADVDSKWDAILQLVNLDSCVAHLYEILLPEELFSGVNLVIIGQT